MNELMNRSNIHVLIMYMITRELLRSLQFKHLSFFVVFLPLAYIYVQNGSLPADVNSDQ